MAKTIRKAPLSSRILAKKIAEFASDKKAEDILILDMRKVVNFCDYFVLSSGGNDRQVKAIADHIEESLVDLGIKPRLGRNDGDASWSVFDAGNVVAHVFQKQVREFYKLEYLWREAKVVPFKNN